MTLSHRFVTLALLSVLLLSMPIRPDVQAKEGSAELQQGSITYQDISSGQDHVCALTGSGQLVCWGSNAYGQIGSVGDVLAARSTPGTVPNLAEETIVDFVAGDYNSCIINAAGALKCWGTNNSNELGNPDYHRWYSGIPMQVSGMESGVAKASIGYGQICALKDSGDLYCWGDVWVDSVDGPVLERKTEPFFIGNFSNPKDLHSYSGHSCVLTDTDELMCWGRGDFGQLGVGEAGDLAQPAKVAGLAQVTSFSLGGVHSCAVTAPVGTDPAKLWCWGDNQYGQLGQASTEIGTSNSPLEVTGLTGEPVSVAAGETHTCAIVRQDGVDSVMCWGHNGEGQLGIGHTEDTPSPTAVAGSAGAAILVAGGSFTALLTDTGQIKSWGGNSEGQLGNGFFFRRQLPIHLSGIDQPLADVVTGEQHTCALTQAGAVLCWGRNQYGQLGVDSVVYSADPVPVTGLASGVASIAAGSVHTCALLDTGEVKCWGNNPMGGLGTGDLNEPLSIPQTVKNPAGTENLSGVAKVSCGASHTCALMQDGSALCWGSNFFGQLGVEPQGEISIVSLPVAVSFEGKFADLALGTDHTCAISEAGDTYCWGGNYNGQLGLGGQDSDPHPVPARVEGMASSVVQMDAGGHHTCALSDSGGVTCWGQDIYSPVPVPTLESGVASISTGGALGYLEFHTCALMEATGAVKCWGYNNFAQLGDGTYQFFGPFRPVNVLGLAGNVTAVTAGGRSSCALFESGAAACWGADYQMHTTPVDQIEVDEQLRPPSIFFSNYYEGSPGSYFVITGLYFPPNQPVNIFINETLAGSALASETGVFKFFAFFGEAGEYTVRVESSDDGSFDVRDAPSFYPAAASIGQGELSITVSEVAALRSKEGDGYTVGEEPSGGSVFLPMIVR